MGGAMKAAQNALRKLRRPHAGCANDCSTTITRFEPNLLYQLSIIYYLIPIQSILIY